MKAKLAIQQQKSNVKMSLDDRFDSLNENGLSRFISVPNSDNFVTNTNFTSSNQVDSLDQFLFK